MSELLTAAQMRAIEQAAIESGEVTGLELMERAGQGVVEAIFELWPDVEEGAKRAVVLCGPGNNGGDGFVIARLLRERGWDVQVFLYGDAEKLPPDARVNYERWCDLGAVEALDVGSLKASAQDEKTPLLIDALFGTGLTRPVAQSLIDLANGKHVVSVDLPSGLCSDSGAVIGADSQVVAADLTVSFHRQKLGHILRDGASVCGKTVVKDIGLSDKHANGIAAEQLVQSVHVDGSTLAKQPAHHKFTHGHALILSGASGKTGAARLAARGVLRVGAGLVTLGVPPAAQQEVACQITALMLQRVADAEGFAEALKDTRINALCLGPGMGQERARGLVPTALKSKRATVLDADALSAFAEEPEQLFEMLHDKVVLTPHGGEFARLFPDLAERLAAPPTKGPAYSKVDATREAAARAGCVVLFKGPDTVIASPTGQCAVNAAVYDRVAPWLATAGSGDVLAGFITGLLARGFAPQQAAETGAWLHVECARAFGAGLIAEDLPEMVPVVLSSLEHSVS